MGLKIKGNILYCDGAMLEFDNNIDEFVVVDDIIVVLSLNYNMEKTSLNNVYGVENGKIIWRVQNNSKFEEMPYTGLNKLNDNAVIGTDFMGRRFIIDLHTGKIIGKKSSVK